MPRLFAAVTILVVALVAFPWRPAEAADPDARTLLDESFKAQVFEADRATGEITLRDTLRGGRTRDRKIRIKAKKTGEGRSSYLMHFLAPDDVKGTGFLSIERGAGQEDDQFLFLPALKKVKRILGNQRSDSFMGTQFSYNDLQSRNLDEGTHKLLRKENRGGVEVYVIESIPKAPEPGDYGRTVSYLRVDNRVPVLIEFFDQAGKAVKVLTTQKAEKKGARWLVTVSTMKNLVNGLETQIVIDTIDFDTAVPDAEFTQERLQSL